MHFRSWLCCFKIPFIVEDYNLLKRKSIRLVYAVMRALAFCQCIQSLTPVLSVKCG